MNAPTKAEIKESLLRSSYLLEGKLEKLLASRDFYVMRNEVYSDKRSGKSTELGMYAISATQVGKKKNYVFPVLLIECVNNDVPLAFFVKEQDSSTRLLDRGGIKLAGMPMVVTTKKGTIVSLAEYLKIEEYHHYWKGRVATQFCSFVRNKKDIGKTKAWTAFRKDPHFASFRRLMDAGEYQIDHLLNNITSIKYKKASKPKREKLAVEFYYPVLVVQGKLLEVSTEKDKVKVRSVNHIQFQYRFDQKPIVRGEVKSISADTNLYRIDVVTGSYFPKYVTMIKREMSTTARRLARSQNAVRQALTLLPAQIGELLERGSNPRAAFTLSAKNAPRLYYVAPSGTVDSESAKEAEENREMV